MRSSDRLLLNLPACLWPDLPIKDNYHIWRRFLLSRQMSGGRTDIPATSCATYRPSAQLVTYKSLTLQNRLTLWKTACRVRCVTPAARPSQQQTKYPCGEQHRLTVAEKRRSLTLHAGMPNRGGGATGGQQRGLKYQDRLSR